jgi:hypothetical protein
MTDELMTRVCCPSVGNWKQKNKNAKMGAEKLIFLIF